MKEKFTFQVRPVFVVILLIALAGESFAQTLPRPDHIVICIMENHPYAGLASSASIIGNSSAPYINALAMDSGANFTSAHAIEHPSQPNYLDLFSGGNQGVTNDNVPSNYPFTTANLGRQLVDS